MAASIFFLLISLPLVAVQVALWQNRTSISTEQTATRSEMLPDGSRVTLSGGTQLERRKDFTRRDVWLDGEVAFEVRPFEGGQFIVWTDAAKIVVTGTAFVVNAYPGAPTTVSVSEGVVRVYGITENGDLTAPLTVKAGERARVFKSAAPQKLAGEATPRTSP